MIPDNQDIKLQISRIGQSHNEVLEEELNSVSSCESWNRAIIVVHIF